MGEGREYQHDFSEIHPKTMFDELGRLQKARKTVAVILDALRQAGIDPRETRLLDIGCSTGILTRHYAEFFGPETAFVLVTLPSEVSRGVVSRSVAALGRMPNRLLGYIENMSGYYCADCDKVKPLFHADDGAELPAPCLGRVPFDPALSAPDAGSPASSSLDEIARKIRQEISK